MSSATPNGFVKDAWQTPRNARTLRAFMALQNQEIAERLKELRKAHGNPPQTDVAEAIGAGERTVQTWEQGEAKPSYRFLQKLAAYYGVGEDYILTGQSKVETPNPFKLSEQIDGVNTEFREDVDQIKAELQAIRQQRITLTDEIAAQNKLLADQAKLLADIRGLVEVLRGARAIPKKRAADAASPTARPLPATPQEVLGSEPPAPTPKRRRRAS